MSPGLSRRNFLAISLIETALAGAIVVALVYSWYPGNYLSLFDARYKVFGFVVLLLLLGPALGVFLYKPDQDAYVNDLSVIYLVRFCVVLVGLHLAYSQRPVLVVFSVDRFVVVQAHQIALKQVPPSIVEEIRGAAVPPLIAAKKLPEDNLDLLLEVMGGGMDIEYRPSQYESFKYQKNVFYDRMCRQAASESYREVSYEAHCDQVRVPLVYQGERFATAVFDSKESEIETILLRNPW